ncbi:MAG TPA: helix-turn-helix transcriptional regulator [Acidimicrobiales bacterium]|nr:helix-turn-helix transcriptional regulator [Acidimicrobiales bacterium]
MTDVSLLIRGRRLADDGRGRRLRERAGLSVSELAHALGVDVGTLSRWETGKAKPRPESALRWASACEAIERELENSR